MTERERMIAEERKMQIAELREQLHNAKTTIERMRSELAALRARCTRQGGDPTVEQLRLHADQRWVDSCSGLAVLAHLSSRALLRAWGEEV